MSDATQVELQPGYLPPHAALAPRRVGIDTYRENVAYLHRACALYRAEGFQALEKVEIRLNGHRIFATLNVVDDERIVAPDEIGLSEQAHRLLAPHPGQLARVSQAGPPASMDSVRDKIAGKRLSLADFSAIAHDVVQARYSRMELAAFLLATTQGGLDREEVLDLTRAMIDSGERIVWDEPLIADKHSIGGIPGNRTSMLIVPIVAAHGIPIPKTSSRAITSPAGTADTMEVLAEVDLSLDRLRELVHREHGALAWGGTARLAPVDDVLISVERPLVLDSPGLMVASILSKKVAAGATHLLVDIPVGPTAKVRQMREAVALRKLFEFVGSRLGLHIEVMLTDGRQPIGRGVGPVLEARDVTRVLACDPAAPGDLRDKALELAGRIIEFDPGVRGGDGLGIARELLDSGRALAKMNAIIDAQGRKTERLLPGSLVAEIKSPADGFVTGVDNLQLARIARLAGAPMDKSAGIDLFRRLGDRVAEGEPLYRIHAEFAADFRFATEAAARHSGYRVEEADATASPFTQSQPS